MGQRLQEYIATKRAAGLQYDSKYASHDLIPSFHLCE